MRVEHCGPEDHSRRAPGAFDLAAFEDLLRKPQPRLERRWSPVFLQLAPGEFQGLEAVCERHGITLLDSIDRQLLELGQVRLPAGRPDDWAEFVSKRKAEAGDRGAVGAWVFFPWESRVVHLLARNDFLDVVSDRNRDKITREEQLQLRTKRVGIVGLSVGAEAAVTIAQENLCGSIVLADFDKLDLSNLNRIGAGVADLGMNKAILAARRIVKINPYLDITVFPEGVSPENLDAFLDSLDLLVDECDGLAIKRELRAAAIQRHINLIFAGDERGFLSVEPYALKTGLPPFHGRLSPPDHPTDDLPDKRAMLRELTEWLGGWEAISDVSRRSIEQIGETLSGYPQLASEARFAAGLLGHVARRLLLGDRIAPFLGHLDLDEMLPFE